MSSPENVLGEDEFDAELRQLFDELADADIGEAELRARAGLELIRAQLLEKLPLYGVESQVVSDDDEEQAMLFSQYATRYREQVLYNLEFSREGVQGDDYPKVAFDMMIAYYEERAFQSIVVHAAATIANAYANNLEDERNRYIVYGTKKELQADFMIQYGRKADDPMLVFFREETPGDNLDVTDPGDKVYLDIAQTKKDKFDRERSRKMQVIEAAKDMLGLDVEDCSEEEMALASHLLIEMYLEASMNSTERQANRTEQLTAIARQFGRSNAMTNALVAMFEGFYPISQR